jgi:hypothetical protein
MKTKPIEISLATHHSPIFNWSSKIFGHKNAYAKMSNGNLIARAFTFLDDYIEKLLTEEESTDRWF